jgi:hypothetical protein
VAYTLPIANLSVGSTTEFGLGGSITCRTRALLIESTYEGLVFGSNLRVYDSAVNGGICNFTFVDPNYSIVPAPQFNFGGTGTLFAPVGINSTVYGNSLFKNKAGSFLPEGIDDSIFGKTFLGGKSVDFNFADIVNPINYPGMALRFDFIDGPFLSRSIPTITASEQTQFGISWITLKAQAILPTSCGIILVQAPTFAIASTPGVPFQFSAAYAQPECYNLPFVFGGELPPLVFKGFTAAVFGSAKLRNTAQTLTPVSVYDHALGVTRVAFKGQFAVDLRFDFSWDYFLRPSTSANVPFYFFAEGKIAFNLQTDMTQFGAASVRRNEVLLGFYGFSSQAIGTARVSPPAAQIRPSALPPINAYGTNNVRNVTFQQQLSFTNYSIFQPVFPSNTVVLNWQQFIKPYYSSSFYSFTEFGTNVVRTFGPQHATNVGAGCTTEYGVSWLSNWLRFLPLGALDSISFGTSHVRYVRAYVNPQWEVFTLYGNPRVIRYNEVDCVGFSYTAYGNPALIFSNLLVGIGFNSFESGGTVVKNRAQAIVFDIKDADVGISTPGFGTSLIYDSDQYFTFDIPIENVETAFYGYMTNVHNRNRAMEFPGFDSFYWRPYAHAVGITARIIYTPSLPTTEFGDSWISRRIRSFSVYGLDSSTIQYDYYTEILNKGEKISVDGFTAYEFGEVPEVWNNRRYRSLGGYDFCDFPDTSRVSHGIQYIELPNLLPGDYSLTFGTPSVSLHDQYVFLNPMDVDIRLGTLSVDGPYFYGFSPYGIPPPERYGNAAEVRNKNRPIKPYQITEPLLPIFAIDSSWHFITNLTIDSLEIGQFKAADNKQYIAPQGLFASYITGPPGATVRNISVPTVYPQWLKDIGGLPHAYSTEVTMLVSNFSIRSMGMFIEGFDALKIGGVDNVLSTVWQLRNYYPFTGYGEPAVTHFHRRITVATSGDSLVVPSSLPPGGYGQLAVSPFYINDLGNAGLYIDDRQYGQPPWFGYFSAHVPGLTVQPSFFGSTYTEFGTAELFLGLRYINYKSLSSTNFGILLIKPFKQRLWFSGDVSDTFGSCVVNEKGLQPVIDPSTKAILLSTLGEQTQFGQSAVENKNRPVRFSGGDSLVCIFGQDLPIVPLVWHYPRGFTTVSFSSPTFGTPWITPSPRILDMTYPEDYSDGMTEFDWTIFAIRMRLRTDHVLKVGGMDYAIMGNPTLTNRYQYARIYQVAPPLFPCYSVTITHGYIFRR